MAHLYDGCRHDCSRSVSHNPQAEFTGRVLPLLHQTARCGEFRDISCAYAYACSGSRVDSSSFFHTGDDGAFGSCHICPDESCQYHPRAHSVHWTFHRTVKVAISKNLRFLWFSASVTLRGCCGAAQEIRFTSVRLHHRIYINPVANDCCENHLRNIPNLCMTACAALRGEKDKSEFHLLLFRVFRVFRG